jgi:hypothetical protein
VGRHRSASASGLGGVLGDVAGRMLGLVAPHDYGEERRLLLPPPGDGHPSMARAIPDSVCRSSGSSVRLPAKLTAASVMVLPLPDAWPGGLPCPWTRGTVDTVACRETPGESDRANEVGFTRSTAGCGRLRRRVGWRRLRLGGGACQHRPARSLHPGVVGERGSRQESCSQLVPGFCYARRSERPS